MSPACCNPIPVPSPTTCALPSGNFPGPHQPMDLSDTPASFSSTSIPLARSPSLVPILLSHSELLAVSQEFAIQLGVDTPQTECIMPIPWWMQPGSGDHIFWQQLADLLEEELAGVGYCLKPDQL
ncbi:hypothetical protein F5J12DRAFT_787095 [Pisolithus orientalis]|uniref:uncharacterized protein n=1 Tax=Pisolithus orientalis TaxID=936130 RepID=UPI002224E7EE|nr:uncharacterized protein F5J12DRAFT_787095 [Pisolithus orientalis]KAI5987345.1 hypothetical protein F5J12DRAFT_787095 [Pisolithus orientalis]